MNDKKKLGWDVLEAGGIGHDRIGWWVFVKGIFGWTPEFECATAV